MLAQIYLSTVGFRNLAFGPWHLASGIWNLELSYWSIKVDEDYSAISNTILTAIQVFSLTFRSSLLLGLILKPTPS